MLWPHWHDLLGFSQPLSPFTSYAKHCTLCRLQWLSLVADPETAVTRCLTWPISKHSGKTQIRRHLCKRIKTATAGWPKRMAIKNQENDTEMKMSRHPVPRLAPLRSTIPNARSALSQSSRQTFLMTLTVIDERQ